MLCSSYLSLSAVEDECQPSTADLEKELESCIPGRKFKVVHGERHFGKKRDNPIDFIK